MSRPVPIFCTNGTVAAIDPSSLTRGDSVRIDPISNVWSLFTPADFDDLDRMRAGLGSKASVGYVDSAIGGLQQLIAAQGKSIDALRAAVAAATPADPVVALVATVTSTLHVPDRAEEDRLFATLRRRRDDRLMRRYLRLRCDRLSRPQTSN